MLEGSEMKGIASRTLVKFRWSDASERSSHRTNVDAKHTAYSRFQDMVRLRRPEGKGKSDNNIGAGALLEGEE